MAEKFATAIFRRSCRAENFISLAMHTGAFARAKLELLPR
jgi:hypothetical protein